MIALTTESIDEQAVSESIADPSCGGFVTFSGRVRQTTAEKKVLRLEFEAYEPMALNEMRRIAEDCRQRFGIEQLALVHRLGRLEIGETAVFIAVGSPHRPAAFEACRYVIDTLKETVPIWKKEFFEDGEVWVAAHP